MGSILHFLRAFDAAVQKRVDAVAFFFMRRGHRKSNLKYWSYSIGLVGLASRVMTYDSTKAVGTGAICLFFFLVLQHVMLASDRKAEARPGTLSSFDRFFIAFGPVYKLLAVASPIVEIATGGPRQLHSGMGTFATVAGVIVMICLLVILYLAKTPYTPPPAKEKVSVHVPAPSEA